MCWLGRMQSAPSTELATVSSACNTSSSKPAQQTKNPSPSIRYARCSSSASSLLGLPGTGPLSTVPAHQCQSSSRVTTIRASWATQRDGARSTSPPTSFLHLLCPWQRHSPVARNFAGSCLFSSRFADHFSPARIHPSVFASLPTDPLYISGAAPSGAMHCIFSPTRPWVCYGPYSSADAFRDARTLPASLS
jgi:hypothetical protein